LIRHPVTYANHHRPHALRQVREHGLVLLTLEEADADVVLPQHGEMGLVMQLPSLDRQAEHALQDRQLAIDLGS
jgi:hypothetical protein